METFIFSITGRVFFLQLFYVGAENTEQSQIQKLRSITYKGFHPNREPKFQNIFRYKDINWMLGGAEHVEYTIEIILFQFIGEMEKPTCKIDQVNCDKDDFYHKMRQFIVPN